RSQSRHDFEEFDEGSKRQAWIRPTSLSDHLWTCRGKLVRGSRGVRRDAGKVMRMVKRVLVAAVLALAPGTFPVNAESALLADRLAQTVPARMAVDGVPGVVVVLIEAGSPVWTAAYGLADPETGR